MMIDLWQNWMEKDDLHYLETPFGRAVIAEVHNSDASLWVINKVEYAAHFEHSDGQITRIQSLRQIESLDMAKHLLIDYVTNLEMENHNELELSNLLETLEICRQNIQNDATHTANLNRTVQILREYFGSRE